MKYSLEKFLKIRPRSEKEIRDKLKQKKFKESEIEREIKNLKKTDLINDKRFAKFWIEYRTEFNFRGKRFIEYELKQKGIEKEVYEEYLPNGSQELKEAKELLNQKYPNISKKTDFKTKNKMMAFLSRKGFAGDIVIKVVDDIINLESN